MATGVLGIAGGGSAALNQDVIDKLKAAEAKATVNPIQTKLDNWDIESTKMLEINAANLELINAFKAFSLDNSTNSFEQKTATTTGTAVAYDAPDVSALVEGTTNVSITQLAQKDVYQTSTFSDPTALIDGGQDEDDKISIEVDGTTYDFSTEDATYNDLAILINANANLDASVEQVGDDSYRLVVKSAKTGTDNALTITQDGVDLDFDEDANHVLTAQNLKATIDGTDYDVSSNTITTQGSLKITANKVGDSSITITKDTSSIYTNAQTMADKYNAFLTLVDGELNSTDSKIGDKSALRLMKTNIKDMLFGNYGSNGDLNIFNFGFDVDKSGFLSINQAKFNKSVTNNLDDLSALFTGTNANKGFGTLLATYTDALDGYGGLLTQYSTTMSTNKTKLEEELTKANDSLDAKYRLMAEQFTAYGALIASMEAQFSSLKMTIQQSTAK